MRKDAGFEVTDRIRVGFKADERLSEAIQNMSDYVRSETLALDLNSMESTPLEIEHVSEHENRWTGSAKLVSSGCRRSQNFTVS